jgi:pyruvate dehydrogenase E2 component (dihydrolipoamide acetyltransferase)
MTAARTCRGLQGAKGRGPPGPVPPPKGQTMAAAAPAAAAPAAATAAKATTGGGRAATKPKFTDVENGPIRKIIASRLLESKTTIPHMYAPAPRSAHANGDAPSCLVGRVLT